MSTGKNEIGWLKMGGNGSGRKREIIFNVNGLGQPRSETLQKLLDNNWIEIRLKENIKEQFAEFDSVIIDDKSGKILIKGIKKILEI